MRSPLDTLPERESMKAMHRVRRFRRSNFEHGSESRWLANNTKPWKRHNPIVRTEA